MKYTAMQMIARLLIVSVMFLSMHAARADMIGADQVVAAHSGQAERAALMSVVSRADVSSQLQAMGIDPATAKMRVAAMTDDEVSSLSGKLDSLPAGANGDWGWGLAAVIVIAAVIWYFWGWKKR